MGGRLSQLLTAIALLVSMGAPRVADAQQTCAGDVDGDGTVTEVDAQEFAEVLFGDLRDAGARLRADANDDGVLSAADATTIINIAGFPCATVTPTPSATSTPQVPSATPTNTATNTPPEPTKPTATRTPTGTPTFTRTVTFTATLTPSPRETCLIQEAHLGSTGGALTHEDCLQSVGSEQRYADLYSIAGTPGDSITVNVTPTAATLPFEPFVSVIDSDGQFGRVGGVPPLQFVVTTSAPYLVIVTSRAETDQQLGPYTLMLTAAPCPTPSARTLPATFGGTLDGTECPDPGSPLIGGRRNVADVYTFSVTAIPTNVSITMRQVSLNDSIVPTLTLLGPDGFALVNDDQDVDCTGDSELECVQIRFLALQTGVYTIIASGAGRTGRYSLALASPVCRANALNNIPADRPLTCSGQSEPGCMGTWYGNQTITRCAAPLPIPDLDVPEPGSPADLYSFTASAGDVISVELDADDDAHLYLLGPASAGNPLVAVDDGYWVSGVSGSPQLAATLPRAGTYTIVAAHDAVLDLPDEDTPEGETAEYTLLVQKCPVYGPLDVETGTPTVSTYTPQECFGFGGIPFRSYKFDGTVGQFVSARVSAADVDAFVRIFAPDGSQVANDNDLFDPDTSDALAQRFLPVDGTYFVEVSTSLEDGSVDTGDPGFPGPEFSVQVQRCAMDLAVPGDVSGTFSDADCTLPSGRKFDVWTFAGAAPRAVAVQPPSNGCVVALLAEGLQVPASGCSTQPVEFPLLSFGRYGFIIAADEASTRGSYHAHLTSCALNPANIISYGSAQAGTLTSGDCGSADWFVLRAPAGLVQFNAGIGGAVSADFALAGTLSDAFGSIPFSRVFTDDPTTMFPLGGNLAALLAIKGATPSDTGNYTVATDPAWLR